eukprot:CAMPEP_0175097428 /NCGR_PEP_ID=MMETSP0086_2-20121207/5282_1 /TAXON_ID=136419 /ORGANISM="Unknown Unknown, Strain D1" /LENGTH=478 /DNA_ID=CAMNT_0016370939 /DNA_START=14 /DNA_END=1450 /DNA_ORIENTATION=+
MKFALFLFLVFLGLVLADEEWTSPKSVVFVEDDTWETFRAKSPKAMVFFYAPWCGHCKNAKPDYADASDEVVFKAAMAAVDCTKQEKTCQKFDVKSYPTIKWFDSTDSEGEEYKGDRSSGAFINFITGKVGDVPENFDGVDFSKMRIKQLKKILKDRGVPCLGCTDKSEFVAAAKKYHSKEKVSVTKKKAAKKSTLINGMTFVQERNYKIALAVAEKGWEENGDVVHLIDFKFQKHKEELETPMFVMFYAPWCGHCKSLKPDFAKASTELKGQVELAAIDCDTNKETCGKYNAHSYPTLLYFPKEGKAVTYGGARNAKGIVNWVRRKLDPNRPLEPFVNNPGFGSDSKDVIFMTGDHWDDYRKKNPKMFVMFFAPWCGHCKAMKPAMGEASELLKGVMPVVAVDCTEETDLCGQFDVKGYPTIKYFDSSTHKGEEYTGQRDGANIASFCKNKAAKGAEASSPAAEEEEVVDSSGKQEL